MRRFQCVLLATVAVIGFASIASAADMPIKARPISPPPVVYNWTGCYIGVHAGGGWARTEFTNTVNTTAAFGHLDPGEGFTYTYDGFVGGGQAGCNYQINQWVLGVEGTFAGTTIKADASDLAVLNDDVFTTKINSLATVTARIGYAWNNVLLYGKGGYAGANVQFAVSDTVGPNFGAGSQTRWQSGWTVGGGLEYGLTPNWIIGAEYNYIDLGSASYEVGGGDGSYAFDVKTRIQEVLARVSYKFGP